MRLIRSAVSVGSFTALSRLGGFVREWLQAHFIGASIISDALNYAISFPSFFRRIFAEGAFNASFVPLFSSTLAGDGVQEARRFAESVLSLLAGVLIILVAGVVLFADQIMPFFLPGLDAQQERMLLTVEFTRITFPFLFFISLTAFFSGMLNSIERFIAAASSPAVGNFVIIGTLVLCADFGMNPGKALSIGVLGCGIVQFLWVFVPSQSTGVRLSFRLPRLTPKVRLFFTRLVPAALGASVFQINLIMDMMLSSFLPKGCYSYLKYADRFSQLPLSIIGTAISTALLPMLARQWRKGEIAHAMESQNRALEFALFFALPATVGLIFLAPDLISSFYAHGKFKPCDITPTATTLMALSAGLPAYILVKVFSTSFFSHGDTKTPVILAMISVALNFVINISLIWSLHQIGLALSTCLASWINALMLGFILWRRKLLVLDEKFRKFLPRILITTIVLSLYLIYLNPYFLEYLKSFDMWNWLALILSIFSMGIVYLGVSYLMGTFTWSRIKQHMADN